MIRDRLQSLSGPKVVDAMEHRVLGAMAPIAAADAVSHGSDPYGQATLGAAPPDLSGTEDAESFLSAGDSTFVLAGSARPFRKRVCRSGRRARIRRFPGA